jgi:hypothetical protein
MKEKIKGLKESKKAPQLSLKEKRKFKKEKKSKMSIQKPSGVRSTFLSCSNNVSTVLPNKGQREIIHL